MPGLADKKEASRRLIVRLTLAFYLLLVLDGALRKWVMPGLEKPLIFVKDIAVVAIYFQALRHGWWPKDSRLLKGGLVLAIVFVLVAAVQGLVLQLPLKVVIYGLRMYLWLLPLAFVVGECFRPRDLKPVFKYTVLSLLPMAVLAAGQYATSRDSFLNRTVTGEAAYRFVEEVARCSGTFSGKDGFLSYLSSAEPLVIASWMLLPVDRPVPRLALIASSIGLLIQLVINGNRTPLLQLFFSLLVAAGSTLWLLRGKVRRRGMRNIMVLALGGLLIAGLFLKRQVEQLSERMALREEGANRLELQGRLAGSLFHYWTLLPRLSPLGQGIGIGSGGGAYLAAGARGAASRAELYEYENSRVLGEVGILGLLYIFYKYWLIFWLGKKAIAATRRSNNPIPLQLWSYSALVFLAERITMQNTLNGYAWLFLGLSIAANRIGSNQEKRQTDRLKPGASQEAFHG